MTITPKTTRAALGVAATLVFMLATSISACSDGGPTELRDASDGADHVPQFVINGKDDFDHSAVAAIMVYDPTFPLAPGWRSHCTASLIHKRVLQTAGHCVQQLEAGLAAGVLKAAWISFQHHPQAHFNENPAVADPATAGWYEIESIHNNPDNPDFLALFAQIFALLGQDPADRDPAAVEAVLAIWGKFHDSGAIVLKKKVRGIRPMKRPIRRGEVERRLAKAGCAAQMPGCGLHVVGYGLTELPPPPQTQRRRSALLRWKGIERLWVVTDHEPSDSEFGTVCSGDSGAPIVLVKDNGRDRMVTAISSSPEDPFGVLCTGGALHYRADTESHLAFIKGVIRSLHGRAHIR